MTSQRPSRPMPSGSKQLAAVATAAIPVVMLSSLALAQPAAAAPAPAGPKILPSAVTHGALGTAVKVAARQAGVPTSVVAGSLPSRIAAQGPAVPSSYKVVPGDTISGIASRYGLSTNSVLALNKLSTSSIIYPGQQIKLGGKAAPSQGAPAKTAAKTTATATGGRYVVASGDTISGIASRHGLSTSSVLAANGMSGSTIIYPGQVIRLGGGQSAPVAAAPAKTPVKASSTKPVAGGKYVIKSGDTLSGIAARHGVGLSALAAANGITVNGTIYAGKTLTIPGLNAASSGVTPITTPSLTPDQQVPNTFLNYTYPDAVVADANKNKAALLAAPAPSRAQMKEMVARTAAAMGVDPSLAMAFAQQESGFNHQVVSPANAIGTMQVIPDAGTWASGLVGRKLNLLNPQDNVTAGVAIIRALLRDAPNEDLAIAGYYQGQYSVSIHGMYPDTKNYVASVKANRKMFR
ncbi:lytic transglycosylase [Arthrobacter sp. ERGS1:01]|uniref:LysM peptidoglycan-binding domain-containing protein n=1 Tax=Arthrobacter sp. ERGS1:01 TaxID=1704044 RepID=UPI0006B5AE60|nr:LysM peptidoglycan-binding domain-containing protein [Arthrobacter sp. ERGS1:01]ALE05460.1 lytic transglycosylase [Arthrobacter sp. ERGS1:01]